MSAHQEYLDTLNYMFQQLPMYQRVGAAAFKKDLGNTLELCAALGNPQHQFKSVHIAGTNGKGSTSHILAATMQAAGYKVGLYTSPHYKDFRERIKINGRFITKKYVVDFIANNKATIERIAPSFFEMTVALAFDYFAQQKVDIAIIEVGLGGRLDSTNIILPELSVITNISFDHMNMLGNTLPLIAAEKAGIIKPNVPVVIGETQPEVKDVFEQKAAQAQAPIYFADQYYEISEVKQECLIINDLLTQKKITCNLDGGVGRGAYQQKNLITALKSIAMLQKMGWKVDYSHFEAALIDIAQRVKFMGRWQKIGEQPLIIADSGHNEAGIQYAIEQLSTYTFRQLHIVTGFVNDKDVGKALTLFPKYATYYFAKANIPRGLDAEILKAQANEIGLQGKSYSSVKNALRAAKRNANPDEDMILVFGSIFVVAEVI